MSLSDAGALASCAELRDDATICATDRMTKHICCKTCTAASRASLHLTVHAAARTLSTQFGWSVATSLCTSRVSVAFRVRSCVRRPWDAVSQQPRAKSWLRNQHKHIVNPPAPSRARSDVAFDRASVPADQPGSGISNPTHLLGRIRCAATLGSFFRDRIRSCDINF